ncbi:MAG: DUF697 domain-containing protein [Myxococcota bacterium]
MHTEVHAEATIGDHVVYAMGAAAVPVPLVDLAGVTAVQLSLVRDLAEIYGVDYEIGSGRAIVSALVGASLPRLGASAVKAIPGAGWLLGALTQVALSGATTYALGNVFKRHFEGRGGLHELDAERVRRSYEAHLAQGRRVVRELRRSEPRRARISGEDVATTLAQLERMHEAGEIDDVELRRLEASVLRDSGAGPTEPGP